MLPATNNLRKTFGEHMIESKETLSKRLIKPWTAHGILILRNQAHCVEVEVPLLALDAEELGRAVAANLQYIANSRLPRRGVRPKCHVRDTLQSSQDWMREMSVAKNDLTLAAALLARRVPWVPLKVTKPGLDFYAIRHLWHGGTIPGDPSLVEFLFVIDGSSPTIYVSSDALAAVTRYVGMEFLSIRVSEDELRLRVQDAVHQAGKRWSADATFDNEYGGMAWPRGGRRKG